MKDGEGSVENGNSLEGKGYEINRSAVATKAPCKCGK